MRLLWKRLGRLPCGRLCLTDPSLLVTEATPRRQKHASPASIQVALALPIHDLRFTIYYFSRSDSIGAPSPQAATRWLGNQKLKNRVNVRFMAKVFWSVLSKI